MEKSRSGWTLKYLIWSTRNNSYEHAIHTRLALKYVCIYFFLMTKLNLYRTVVISHRPMVVSRETRFLKIEYHCTAMGACTDFVRLRWRYYGKYLTEYQVTISTQQLLEVVDGICFLYIQLNKYNYIMYKIIFYI